MPRGSKKKPNRHLGDQGRRSLANRVHQSFEYKDGDNWPYGHPWLSAMERTFKKQGRWCMSWKGFDRDGIGPQEALERIYRTQGKMYWLADQLSAPPVLRTTHAT